jgi:HEAT repeat protein
MIRLKFQITEYTKPEGIMKRVLILTAAVTLIAFSTISATDPQRPDSKVNLDQVEATLLNGLNSQNQGLVISSSQKLGKLQSSTAVIPLMTMLKSNNDESCKIAAALALYNIGDKRGIYAIKKAAKFDDSSKVRKFCTKFYNEYKTQS